MDGFAYQIFPVRLGSIPGWGLVVECRGRISALRFNFKNREEARRWIEQNYPGTREQKTKILGSVAGKIREYLQGSRPVRFDFPLDFSGYTDFQKRVLLAARKIPYGRTTTYRRLAGKTGAPGAFRAVGQALGANRHLVLIPCHRVIRSDGKMGGFSAPGGIATKIWLLKLEKSQGWGA